MRMMLSFALLKDATFDLHHASLPFGVRHGRLMCMMLALQYVARFFVLLQDGGCMARALSDNATFEAAEVFSPAFVV